MKPMHLTGLLILLGIGLILTHARLNAAAMSAEPSTTAQRGASTGAAASAAAATTQVNLSPVADAFVDSSNSGTNNGGATSLYLGTLSTNMSGRALFRFDLSTIPTNAIVDSATFRVYLVQTSTSPTSLAVRLHRIDASWTEYGVIWNNQPLTSPTGSTTRVGIALQSYTWDVKSPVQTWVNGAANNGLALMSKNETTIGWRSFASRESTNPPNPPRLVVTYRP